MAGGLSFEERVVHYHWGKYPGGRLPIRKLPHVNQMKKNLRLRLLLLKIENHSLKIGNISFTKVPLGRLPIGKLPQKNCKSSLAKVPLGRLPI